jgi:polar amino acid transport system substrate-binding protein
MMMATRRSVIAQLQRPEPREPFRAKLPKPNHRREPLHAIPGLSARQKSKVRTLTIRWLAAPSLAALFIVISSLCHLVMAQQVRGEVTTQHILNIATKDTPPFAMKGPDGKWTGLAIDLMTEIARNTGKKIRWTETDTVKGLLSAVAEGRADGAIAAITITADREKIVDFSHGYYESGLAIAVRKRHGASFWVGLEALGSPAFLGTVGVLVALLFIVGALVWLIEKKQNSSHFEKSAAKGVASGFWWAAVTMTTVGYGDKAPITPLGRLVAVIWMFAALILTAVFTAHLTSALTIHRLYGPVTSPADLFRSRVGVVEGTTSGAYLRGRAIRTISLPSIASGLEALEAGVIDAFVHDEPILRYNVHLNHVGRLELLPQLLDPQAYGIALPSGSALREPLDQALLEIVESPNWRALKAKYLGPQAHPF